MAKVLVIDDDPLLSGTLEDWLLSEKHDATVAETGMKGWQCLQKNEYDFVIVDWDLPDLNGPDIVKMFRATGATAPVLMLTGRSSLEDKERGLDCGADDYLTKPFHVKELAARMRAALRKQDSMQRKPQALGENNQELLKKHDLNGTTLAAHYEFLESIGEGGVGIVFKARNPHLDKFVAIKMLQQEELKEASIARFEREAKVISKLEHPNIAVLYDFGLTEKKRPYMVMEFIEGKSLKDLLSNQDGLPLEQALEILLQIGDGLAYAHSMTVLHRDLKPANVMLKESPGRSPLAKILDFGCAKLREEGVGKAPDLTQAGQVFGSPAYMSPEQVKGKQLDDRSDVYSLGCIIYELVTGYPPHNGETAVELMFKHIDEPVVPLAQARPDLQFPVELQHVINFALQVDREQRYQSASAVRADLEKILSRLRQSPQTNSSEAKSNQGLKEQLSGVFNKTFGWGKNKKD